MAGEPLKLDILRERYKPWIQDRTHHAWVEDSQGVVVLKTLPNGKLRPVGASVLDSITKGSCSVHFCLDTPMALRMNLIPVTFDIAFGYLGVKVVFAGIPSTNLKMINLAQHIGFEPIGSLKDAVSGGIDRVMMQMRKEACHWRLREAA